MNTTRLDENRICAIFVTYYPQKEIFIRSINALYPQVDKIVVVDNTTDYCDGVVKKFSDRPVEKIFLKENKGIAAGHNVGIAWAAKHGFSSVLLMDQDSIAALDMVEKLNEALSILQVGGKNVAAVGPNIVDQRSGLPLPFVEKRKGIIRRVVCRDNEYVKAVHIISSGSLIHLSAIDKIGFMEEDLFIDSVDIEWGLRAMHKGFYCYGICSARLYHKLGDNVVNSPLLGKRRFLLHDPLRYYYQYRNAISLYKRPYISMCWILYDFVLHRCVKFMVLLLIMPHPLENTKMMLRGIWHALIGINGPYRRGRA